MRTVALPGTGPAPATLHRLVDIQVPDWAVHRRTFHMRPYRTPCDGSDTYEEASPPSPTTPWGIPYHLDSNEDDDAALAPASS
jgi:hypothetical protein